MKHSRTLISSLLALASSSAAAVESYDIIDLGNLGTNPAFVFDVNNAGIAVGYSAGPLVDVEGSDTQQPDFTSHAFAFDNPTMTDLGAIVNDTESFDLSVAFSINENNVAIGYSFKEVERTDSNGDPFTTVIEKPIYIDTASQAITEIPSFDASDEQPGRALSGNDNTLFVGFGKFNPPDDTDDSGNALDTYYDRGFIYDSSDSSLVRIDPLTDNTGLLSVMRDVNNNGIATGWAQKNVDDIVLSVAFYVDHADPTNVVEMSLLSDGNSFPWAINNAGVIVGRAADAEKTHFTAFSYDVATQSVTDLGVLNENSPFSEAFDINNNNQIVGTSTNSVFPTTNHAFIYEDGVMKDLNDLIDCKVDGSEPIAPANWTLSEARAINDNGVIVGNGILDGVPKGFMLIPRPGQQPQACQPFFTEDSSGSGSFPLSWIAFLLVGGIWVRRKS
ncbi:DUF3466 family protein [Aliikangiella coralliicola]|uniref:DUF3466 family protein n=1 Tax=Aliikangiella coralliicola TaxID=2592383 RepID=A0A545TSR0_9GAMM|nr:DUF3466 family protein [Aliikangiella coralliicola]TQV80264.1 DUF3466 family protein [Aliikangiella coralliicola]